MKRITAILTWTAAFILLSGGVASAQKATVRGVVLDAVEQVPLMGATVRIFNAAQIVSGAYTDLDGAYQTQIPPGRYRLVVSYVGYAPDTLDIEAAAGQVISNRTALNTEASAIQEVEITAQRSNSSINEGIIRKMSSINAIEVVSSELFSRAGANTAADALRMAPAVSITEGKYINVRGLSDRYNRTLINMGEIPPLDPDRETVQLDLFPASLIDNLTVYKNFTPDLPGAFTAGLVDIQTKSHPDKFELNFSGSLGFNDVTSLRGNFLTQPAGRWGWLGIDDGARAFPDPGQPFGNIYTAERRNSGLNQSYSFSVGDQKLLFGRPFGYLISTTYQLNQQNYENYEVGRYFIEIIRGSAGQDSLAVTEGSYLDGHGDRMETETLAGVVANLAYKPSNNHKLMFVYMLNQGGLTDTRELTGNESIDGDVDNLRINHSLLFTQQTLNAFQLKGRHAFGRLDVDWTGSYSLSSIHQPDFRVLSYDAVVDRVDIFENDTTCFDPDCIFYVVEPRYVRTETDTTKRRVIISGTDAQTGRFFRELSQNTGDFKANATLNLWNDGSLTRLKLKAGGAYTYKGRQFNERQFDLLFSGSSQSAETVDETGGLYASSVQAFFSTYPDYSYRELNNIPGIPYMAEQTLIAGYAMAEILPLRQLSVITGLRYESTDMSLDGNPIGSPNAADNQFTNHDLLPALHLIYKPRPLINLRAGYARTLARPSFRENSLFVNSNFKGDFQTAGSPILRRSLIDNLDFRAEWSPTLGELVSVGGFYKEILGPIELVFTSGGFLEYQNLRTGPDTDPIRPVIPKKLADDLTGQLSSSSGILGELSIARAYGLEVEIRKNFAFLGEGWQNLQIWGNYSLLRTEVPLDERSQTSLQIFFGDLFTEGEIPQTRRLYGQPTHTVNAELAYVDKVKTGLEASISYNLFGERLVAVYDRGINILEQSRGLLNASVRKRFGQHVYVRVRGSNLLNPAHRQVYRVLGTDLDVAQFENFRRGRSYSLGISYEL